MEENRLKELKGLKGLEFRKYPRALLWSFFRRTNTSLGRNLDRLRKTRPTRTISRSVTTSFNDGNSTSDHPGRRPPAGSRCGSDVVEHPLGDVGADGSQGCAVLQCRPGGHLVRSDVPGLVRAPGGESQGYAVRHARVQWTQADLHLGRDAPVGPGLPQGHVEAG